MSAALGLPSQATRVLVIAAGARSAQFVDSLLFLLVAAEANQGTSNAVLALLAYQLAVVGGTLAAGSEADRLGTRPVVVAGLLLAAGGAGALATFHSSSALIAAAALYGFGAAAWRLALETAAARALAGGAARADREMSSRLRARAFGALACVRNAGAAASAVAIALGIDLRSAIAAQAVITATVAIAGIASLPPGEPPRRQAAGEPRAERRSLWLLALATAPGVFVVFQAFSGLAAVYEEETFRVVIFVNAFVLVLAAPAVAALSTRLGGGQVLIGGTLALGLAMGAAPALEDVAPLATVAWSVAELPLLAVVPAVVTGLAPAPMTGHYQARLAVVHGSVAAVAVACGPLLVEASETAFTVAAVGLGVVGAAALRLLLPVIDVSLSRPVGCPGGAFACAS